MSIIKTSKATQSEWLGRPGSLQIFHLDSKKTGLRVSTIKWLDGSDEATVKLIQGDGRSKNFTTYAEVTTTHADMMAKVEELAS